ncbi:MAG: hypothetical protein ACYCYO_00260 [Bacilli bacterium]
MKTAVFLPIVDLWTLTVHAYAALTATREFVSLPSPVVLREVLHAARDHTSSPLVIHALPALAEEADWTRFLESMGAHNPCLRYGVDWPSVDGATERWVREIDTAERLEEVLQEGARYGSGLALASVLEFPLEIPERVKWIK